MVTTATPITAFACMACTVPYNATSSSYEKIEANQNNITMNEENNVYVVHAEAATIIPTKKLYSSRTQNYNYVSHNNYRRMKVSRKTRRNHNIHQPGRTNCTQRYQK